MTDEPLIYTSKGNLPLSSLTYEVKWERTDTYVKFVEIHRTADGEVVREAAHVLALQGLAESMFATDQAGPDAAHIN
jgi:hypothetical protein